MLTIQLLFSQAQIQLIYSLNSWTNLELTLSGLQINSSKQEIMKVREVIPHTGPIPIVIPLKLFLGLLRDPVFPRGLTDSQSHVPIFTNVDS